MNYSWGDRVSTYTGLPTIVGWPFHELQWRGTIPELEIWENWLDMDRIYQTTDPAKALELLKEAQCALCLCGTGRKRQPESFLRLPRV